MDLLTQKLFLFTSRLRNTKTKSGEAQDWKIAQTFTMTLDLIPYGVQGNLTCIKLHICFKQPRDYELKSATIC